MRLFKFVVLSIVLMGLISPGTIQFWHWNQENRQLDENSLAVNYSQFLPIISNIPNIESDDCYRYYHQRIEIWRCNDKLKTTIWESPDGWKITEVISADLNRDGIDEIGLLVWRPFESWPIDKFLPNKGRIANFHDQNSQSCHLILIGWDGTKYRELWAGSALADPISDLKTADIDNDGFEELIALEKKYDASSGSNLTVWEWQGFGFTLVERLEGIFSNYSIVSNDGQLIVLTN